MGNPFTEYLSLLDEVCDCVERLSDLARRKTEAVRKDEVEVLNQVMKEEQALSLTIRGLEQKRTEGLKQLDLVNVPLNELAAHYPPEFCMQAKEVAERLRTQYQIYRSAAEVARNTLECNLHEIQKIFSVSGGGSEGGPGYIPSDAPPPKFMKTDFRA